MPAHRLGRAPGSARAHDSLVKACLDLLKLHGIEAAAINRKPVQRKDGTWHNPGAPVGFPDIVACLRRDILGATANYLTGTLSTGMHKVGHMILVECKTGRSPVRPEQREALARWARAGALCFTVRAVDDLLAGLRREGVVR